MANDGNQSQIEALADDIIRRWIQRLRGRAGLSSADLEDLEQVLRIKLLQSKIPPDMGTDRREQIITTIIARRIANFLRDRRAAKRDYRRLRSLNLRIETKDDRRVELGETLDQGAHGPRLGRSQRDEQEQVDLV